MALTDKLKAIADAIRAKTGKSDSMTLAEMPAEIENISTGGSGINPEWTDWRYFSYNNNRNSLVEKLKYNDTSNGTNFAYMFRGCDKLTFVPEIDTSKGQDFSNMFYACSLLVTISTLNLSNGTNFSNMFQYCYILQNITFLGTINISANINFFGDSKSLTVNSLMSFINALQNKTGTTYKVTIGSQNLAKLTEEQIQIATDKNITLA